MPDSFPEAFKRFEDSVPFDINKFKSYRELAYSFMHWAGERWVGSYRQQLALKREGERLGFEDARVLSAFFEKQPERVTRLTKRQKLAISRRKWKRQVRVSRTVERSVKWYVSRGYSANKIQRALKRRGIGFRRKTLLMHIRKMRRKKIKAHPEKYVRKKYRRQKK
jgi:hypothetical protein